MTQKKFNPNYKSQIPNSKKEVRIPNLPDGWNGKDLVGKKFKSKTSPMIMLVTHVGIHANPALELIKQYAGQPHVFGKVVSTEPNTVVERNGYPAAMFIWAFEEVKGQHYEY